MARVGYARVSPTDQDLDIQVARLKAAGCEIVRSETGSGASRTGRTELETIMQFLRAEDELVVLRLSDQLAALKQEVDALEARIGGMGRSAVETVQARPILTSSLLSVAGWGLIALCYRSSQMRGRSRDGRLA